MKRHILIAALALGLTLPAMAQGAIPQPIYFWESVAATISAPGQPSAPEVIRPPLIFLFADGSWAVDHLQWTGWGSSIAHATGISSASNGIPSMAAGKRIKKPAQITLSNPGLFQGHEVYRCFTLTVPSYPRSDQHLCLTDHRGFWFLAASTPAKTSTTPTTTKGGQFVSHGVSCGIYDGIYGGSRTVSVTCEDYISQSTVSMGPAGQLKICVGEKLKSGTVAQNICDIGNSGTDKIPSLAYGSQITVGRFRCRSAQAGVTCVVIKSGKGFLINSAGITPVGGATATSVALTSAQFLSPDRKVGCMMEDPSTNGLYVYCNASGLHAGGVGPDGHATICNNYCLGFVAQTTPTLAYGKQITVGRFRCSSSSAGITCVVIRSGKGFLINSAGVTRVGP